MILYFADDAVIADSITPEPLPLALQGFPLQAGIDASCDPLVQKIDYPPLDLTIQFLKLPECGLPEFNAPGQAVSPLP